MAVRCLEPLLNVQTGVHEHIRRKCAWLLEALASYLDFPSGAKALQILTKEDHSESRGAGTRLRADAFDILERSGLANSTSRLTQEHKDIVEDPDQLFPNAHAGLSRFPGVPDKDRREYARLVVRQLRSGKVSLATSVSAGGTIFGVGKKIRTRCVRSGTAPPSRRPQKDLRFLPASLRLLPC